MQQTRDKFVSAHMFPQVYEDLGFSTSNAGCIMLDVAELKVKDLIAPEELYVSTDPNHKYVNGIVSEDVPHITLLYGLMRTGPEMRKHVDAVLDGWKPEDPEIESVGYFESTDEAEPYYCLVAHIKVSDNLIDAHGRLSFLPHVDTFIEYKPHITLAYIKKDEALRDEVLAFMDKRFTGTKVSAKGINYGE